MAGFLDAKERVLDVIITGIGKSLITKGDLNFVYWIPFDDEVDYDPYISTSASLSSSDLIVAKQVKTEDPLIREACSGYRYFNKLSEDNTNVYRPLFTLLPGKKVVPQMSTTDTVDLTINQRVLVNNSPHPGDHDITVQRYGSSKVSIEASYDDPSEFIDRKSEGFLVTVYLSGTEGFKEVLNNRDSNGNITYLNDLQVELGSK
jgi:hypothetical protein